MPAIPKLRPKTPAERGPIDPDSLTAALFWDRLAPADPIDQPQQARPAEKGGAGSGNWGHAGRPGVRGGSAAGTGGAATRLYSYMSAKRQAAIDASPAAKAVDKKLKAGLRAKGGPDEPQENIDAAAEMLHDALQLGPDRWDHYAPAYGVPNDLKTAYYKELGQVDRDMVRLEMEVKDRATVKDPKTGKPVYDVWTDPEKEERYHTLIGADYQEAENMIYDTFKVRVSDYTGGAGIDPQTRHENASAIYNTAMGEPAIAATLRSGTVKGIEYVRPVPSDTAWASWTGSKILVKGLGLTREGPRNYSLPAGIFAHETGHAFETWLAQAGMAETRTIYRTFGMGKMMSSYSWKSPAEDFAETFKAVIMGYPEHHYTQHSPQKVKMVRDLINEAVQ